MTYKFENKRMKRDVKTLQIIKGIIQEGLNKMI